MVQRQVPNKLGIQDDHFILENQPRNPKQLNSQYPDGKNKEETALKKKTRNPDIESLDSPLEQNIPPIGKPPPVSKSAAEQKKESMIKTTVASPNYMKSTSCSNAKKERTQISRKNPGQINQKRVPEKLAVKKHSKVALSADINVRRATCSSTLKDSKFQDYIKLNPGGTELNGSSVMKVCSYTYCSLNGHFHAPLPPLKSFLSAKRRLMKAQNYTKIETLSPGRPKDEDVTAETSRNVLHDGDDFEKNEEFEDLNIKTRSEAYLDEHNEVDFEDNLDETIDNLITEMEFLDSIYQELTEEGADTIDNESDPNEEKSSREHTEKFDPETSDMEWEEGNSTSLQTTQTDFTAFEKIVADELLQGACEEESTNLEFKFDEDDSEPQGLYHDFDQELVQAFKSINYDNLSFPDEQFEESTKFDEDDSEIIQGYQHDDNNAEQSELDQPVVDDVTLESKILSFTDSEEQENSDRQICDLPEPSNGNVDNKENQDNQINKSQEEENTCMNLNSIIQSKRSFVDEDDESRSFNPREPNYLPVKPDEESKKHDLKHQTEDERKNSEEWMLDYALQRAVTKLAPARSRRVALLVEAFETVKPTTVPKCETHQSHSSSAFTRVLPFQTCI